MSSAKKKQLYGVVFALIVVVISSVSGSALFQNDSHTLASSGSSDNLMTVNFVDVGQGDCQIVVFPDGSNLLIDCGEAQYAEKVEAKLESAGCSKIDTLVITHPHTDHMGGMSRIISDYEVGEIYMPQVTANTKTYAELLETIAQQDLTINAVKAGTTLAFSEDISGEFLAPVRDDYEEMNNYSAVLKLSYADVSFLFTGDAEALSEKEMLERSYAKLDCDVLKVGHHGSSSASSEEFLAAVSPSYAVIGCGENNKYGHPHNETLLRLEACSAAVYRTDINGDIAFITDGRAIEIDE